MKEQLKNFKRYSFLLEELVKKGIKLKYRRSYLGILWSLLEPLLTMIVLTLVFGKLLGKGNRDFPVYILSGRLLYSFFSSSTKACLSSIRKNASMIKKIYVPKYLYPMSSVLVNFIIFAISLPVLFVVSLVLGVMPTWHIFLALIPLILLLMLSYGVGMILATIGVFFRDMEYIWSVGLMLVMYTCAIFYYPDTLLKDSTGWLLKLNPLFCIIDCFRAAIYSSPMNMKHLLYAAVFSLISLIFGLWIFKRNQDNFILHI